MTVNQVKIDILRRGYSIGEAELNGNIQIVVVKTDTDNLVFNSRGVYTYGIYDSDEDYIDVLKETINDIDKKINKRHYQNINNCQHEPVMIGTKKACANCMGKFGDRMMIDINNN